MQEPVDNAGASRPVDPPADPQQLPLDAGVPAATIPGPAALKLSSGGLSTGVPQRELRLLVEGIREWLSRLSAKDSELARPVGFLEGDPGQGQRDLLDALRTHCSGSGIQVLWGTQSGDDAVPPGASSDLAYQALQLAAAQQSASGEPGSCFSPEVLSELQRIGGQFTSQLRTPLPSLGHELDRSRLVDALARSLFELSARAPLLLIVEELTRLDPLTQDVFCHLVRLLSIRASQKWVPRLLVIASVPTGFELSSFGNLREVALRDLEAFRVRARGFSRDDLKDLSVRTLKDPSTLSFRERVLQITGGNFRHSRWMLWRLEEDGNQKAASIPEKGWEFPALVRHRFGKLAPAEQKALSLLAAAGVPCCATFVDALTAGKAFEPTCNEPCASESGAADSTSSVLGVLNTLTERGWLVRARDGESIRVAGGSAGPGSAVRDAFAMVDEDVAALILGTLAEEKRKALHALLGREFQRLGQRDDLWYPVAFRQLRRAGDNGAASQVLDSALKTLEQLGCLDSALVLLEEQMTASAESGEPPRIELQVRRAELLAATRNYREAILAYESLARSDEPPEVRSRAFRLLGGLHARLGEREESFRAHNEGLMLVDGCHGSMERLKLLSAFARLHLEAKELDLSLGYLDRCLEVVGARGLTLDSDYVEIYRLAEEVHFHRSDYVEAAEFERCLLQRCEASGDIRGILKSQRHLAHLHALRDEWDEAEAYLLESMRRAKSTGSRWLYARALLAFGLFQRNRRDLPGALKSLQRAHGLLVDLGKTEALGAIVSAVVGLELELGRFDAAAHAMRAYLAGWEPGEDLLARDRAFSNRDLEPALRRKMIRRLEKKCSRGGQWLEDSEVLHLSTLLLWEGRLADAHNVCRAYLKRESTGDTVTHSAVSFALGRLCALAGDFDAALARFEGALNGKSGSPERGALSTAYLEVSAVFLARGDIARAFEYVSRGTRLALEESTPFAVLLALERLADFFLETGQPTSAISVAQGLVQVTRDLLLPLREVPGLRILTRAQAESTEDLTLPEVTGPWQRLVEALETPVESARYKLETAWISYRKRDFESASKFAREGIDLARSAGLLPLIDELLHVVGVIEGDSRNPRKNFLRALDALEQALRGAETRKCPRLRWEILKDISSIYRERGKDDLADEYHRRAEEIELIVKSALPRVIKDLRWHPRLRLPATVTA